MLLAWAARLIVVVVWLVVCCSWLAPRLPLSTLTRGVYLIG